MPGCRAEKTGAVLAECGDLYVENNCVYLKTVRGGEWVGAIYRRISDEYLDPLTFKPESLIGIPGVMDAYRAGNVALLNAPGNGVADDKGIYYFVPKMIQYYLGEEPILHNAPTYLPFYEDDRSYVLDHLETLVVDEETRSMIKLGTSVERVDLYLRLNEDADRTRNEFERLFNRLYKTQLAPEKCRLKLLTDSLLDSSKPTASVPEQIEALEGLFLDL